jgi:hypothetical protein
MLPLETLSGIALLVVVGAVFAPFWWPPVRGEIEGCAAAIGEATASLPARWRTLKAGWVSLFFVTVCGGVWLYWTTHSPTPLSDRTQAFGFLFLAIAFGTFMGAVVTLALAAQIWLWLFEGPSSETLPALNPLNRVGYADPLGEARFATANETHAALLGRAGNFNPPRFPD